MHRPIHIHKCIQIYMEIHVRLEICMRHTHTCGLETFLATCFPLRFLILFYFIFLFIPVWLYLHAYLIQFRTFLCKRRKHLPNLICMMRFAWLHCRCSISCCHCHYCCRCRCCWQLVCTIFISLACSFNRAKQIFIYPLTHTHTQIHTHIYMRTDMYTLTFPKHLSLCILHSVHAAKIHYAYALWTKRATVCCLLESPLWKWLAYPGPFYPTLV